MPVGDKNRYVYKFINMVINAYNAVHNMAGCNVCKMTETAKAFAMLCQWYPMCPSDDTTENSD